MKQTGDDKLALLATVRRGNIIIELGDTCSWITIVAGVVPGTITINSRIPILMRVFFGHHGRVETVTLDSSISVGVIADGDDGIFLQVVKPIQPESLEECA